MKNTECTIYIMTNKGKILQSIRKEKTGWKQTVVSNGNVHAMTAEQLLSHLLPALAFGHATIKVVPDNGVKGISDTD